MAKSHKKILGFTLVELLVAIAIMGILAAVVLSSIAGARKKARINEARGILSSVLPVALICIDDQRPLELNGGFSVPLEGDPVCKDVNNVGSNVKWPKLPSGWNYGNENDSGGDSYDTPHKTFSYSASGDDTIIRCVKKGDGTKGCF